MSDQLPLVLFVGGIDSSGFAGLDADREACVALECEPVLIASAATDQDLFQVKSVEERLLWHRDADDVLRGERPVGAVKFGLLPGVGSIVEAARVVARCRHGATEIPAVVDPVITSSTGYRFWSDRELVGVRDSLLVAGPILTPNLDELAVLAWDERKGLEDEGRRERAARRLIDAGVSAVVVKGGHGAPDRPVRDLVLTPGADPVWVNRPREPGRGIRGSGCRFASALASALARGRSLVEATDAAGAYVAERIRHAEATDRRR